VAYRWRIRYKLMIGLGLVVVVMALTLAGTLKGLLSYRTTMKSIESKIFELDATDDLKLAVADLKPFDPSQLSEWDDFREKMKKARKALQGYEKALEDTLAKGRDPDFGVVEANWIKALTERFESLEATARPPTETTFREDGTDASKDEFKKRVEKTVREVSLASDDLRNEIIHDLNKRIRESRRPSQITTWTVLTTSVLGVLLMAGLLRFFYGWVFTPIRNLGIGAGRVAQGDFTHRIEVNSGDEMEEVAAAFNDMTGRLHEMYTDLERQVNERSRQLVRSERLASVGFLAAGVAHEINNPLASIAFCGEALESRLAGILKKAPQDSETITKYLTMIQQEAFRCKSITQRLLEFSRVGERHREFANLGDLVQSVLDMVEHLQNRKGKRIDFQVASPVSAWVNTQEIKSVVLNLVVNSLDSMDDGGVLTIRLGLRNGQAEIVFNDTGCGMSEEVLENIFEPFFTRSRTGKGTGLGLTISHRIITQHGGEIEAASAGVNRGSTFTVRLPLKQVETKREETPLRLAA
jgi:signal transduction histidine kinase